MKATFFLFIQLIAYVVATDRNSTKIVYITVSDVRYKEVAVLTIPNRHAYCIKHSYPFLLQTEFDGPMLYGFSACPLIFRAFNEYSYAWLLVQGADHIITNTSIKLESLIDDRFHFIIPADVNTMNAGSFLVRNSPLGRAFMTSMCAAMPMYISHPWVENQWIIEMNRTSWNAIMTTVPQRKFNSYVPGVHYGRNRMTDILGYDGVWQPGDFMLHTAGLPLPKKISLLKKYLACVDTPSCA